MHCVLYSRGFLFCLSCFVFIFFYDDNWPEKTGDKTLCYPFLFLFTVSSYILYILLYIKLDHIGIVYFVYLTICFIVFVFTSIHIVVQILSF